MSKIIEVIHPYQLKGIDTLSDYLLVLKNITKLIETVGYKEKMDGILVPIRWSISKNCFVLDRGTLLKRDKEGVSLENIVNADIPNELKIAARYVLSIFKDNKLLNDLCESLGMKKNEDKFLSFEYINGITNRIKYDFITAYPIGLFYMQRNKKSKIIDLSDDIIEVILNTSKKFSCNKNKKSKEKNIFESFIKSIDKRFININVDGIEKSINIKEILYDNNKIYKNKIKIGNKKYHFNAVSLFKKIKEEGCTAYEFNKLKTNIVLMYLNEIYGNFIKSILVKKDNSEGVIVYDKKNSLLYKLTGSFYYDTVSVINKKQTVKSEKQSFNYLPGVF
jgi:hypothetical protein